MCWYNLYTGTSMCWYNLYTGTSMCWYNLYTGTSACCCTLIVILLFPVSMCENVYYSEPIYEEVLENQMASDTEFQEKDLLCPLCHDHLNDPVKLSCDHNVCRVCLQNYRKNGGLTTCPVCHKKMSMNPPYNFTLTGDFKNIQIGGESESKCHGGSEELCSQHGEKLRLFCQVDKEPVCLVCRDSRKHKGHDCLPIEEAAPDCWIELKMAKKSLQWKLEELNSFKQTFDETAGHIESQAQHTKRKINEEFEKLHQFLRDEEEARIAALRQEEQQKSLVMKYMIEEISKEIASLSDTIRSIEEKLASDTLTCLQNYKATVERAQIPLVESQLVKGTLIDVAKHLGNLPFKVWEKMQRTVKYVPVVLDPNTSHPMLSLCDDLTTVRYGEEQQYPDTPERFKKWMWVLGSEGFASGSHSWDVEVGDSTHWFMGVMRENAQIKETPHPDKSELYYYMYHYGEKNGNWWSVDCYDDKYVASSPSRPDIPIIVRQKPRRVRVQLDWDRGQLAFSDPDNKTHLHTFTDTFRETIFPCIFNGCDLHPVRIFPGKVSVIKA
ncbi:hypothetical protein DPEC_G00054560 [Dallia pectoralis]|uniref:Uncharacterized protein n=1 Tax=Dallia pectoralis TaxID=75939 RepID=A0ACC2H577_DALPE|nr:hypothetical protein DPEC_G00054560 [Dallia pectoralis]